MKTLYICAIALLSTWGLNAQTQFGTAYGVLGPSLAGGITPSSLGLSSVEHVNLYNGSLNVTIPLLHVGGRGRSGYDMVLPIERHWRVDYVNSQNSPGSWLDPWYSQLDDDTITPYSPGQLQIKHSSAQPGSCINSGVTQDIGPYVTRLVWIAPDGSETVLRDTTYDGQAQGTAITTCGAVAGYTPVNRGPKFKSNDGSELTFISDSPISDSLNAFSSNGFENNPSGKLYFPDGTIYLISDGVVGDIYDRNGNNTHLVYGYDSLGNGTITITDPAGRIINVSIGWGTTTDTITYPGFDNKSRIITIMHPTMDTVLADGGQ